MNPIDAAVGMNVRQRRIMCGATQDDLAKAVGVSFQQIQKYEKGTNRISASRLVQIATALSVHVNDLVVGVYDNKASSKLPPLRDIRLKHKFAEQYDSIPKDVQEALGNLVQAITISLAKTLKED